MRFWETPVHIPNTMVKTKAADDTILVTVWESRWLPDQKRQHSKCFQYKTGSKELTYISREVLFMIAGFTSD